MHGISTSTVVITILSVLIAIDAVCILYSFLCYVTEKKKNKTFYLLAMKRHTHTESVTLTHNHTISFFSFDFEHKSRRKYLSI